MDWDLLGKVVTGVLTVTSIIATALVGVLFGSLKTLRDTANDLRSRVTDLEKERTDDRAEIVEMHSENRLLKAMVTGKVEWVALTDQVEDLQRQWLAWRKEARETLAQILKEVGGRK